MILHKLARLTAQTLKPLIHPGALLLDCGAIRQALRAAAANTLLVEVRAPKRDLHRHPESRLRFHQQTCSRCQNVRLLQSERV